MPELIIKYADRPADKFTIERLRTTIGRSTRSDICIPDPFASRVHVEVRNENGQFWLQDLASANGTRYNGVNVTLPVPLISGGEIQIGETVIVFQDSKKIASKNVTLITDGVQTLNPAMTIALPKLKNSTSDLFDRIDKQPTGQKTANRSDFLGIISKVGVALLGSKTLDETLNQIADLVFDAVPADRCVIMLHDDTQIDKEAMNIAVACLRGRKEEVGEIRVSHTILKEVISGGNSVLTSDAQHDPRFASQTMALVGIRSVLAVPLSVNESDVFGLIYADSPTYETTFTEEHLQILTTVASVASIRVENASLMEERFIRERMQHELKLATEIQQSLQPSAPPVIEGYEFQGISFSCYEIGGDYYDFIKRSDGKLLIALGDVSGKGTAAALLMSSLHASVHAQVAAKSTLQEIISAVNNYLAENTPSNRFVTLFMAELNPMTGILQFINAGHNPPLIARSAGFIESLDAGGFPLGIIPNCDYELGETTLSFGDVLVVYSDGVSEANNPKGEEFGMDRLNEVIKKHCNSSASRIRDRVEQALESFSDTEPANDDITLVIAKRQAQMAANK